MPSDFMQPDIGREPNKAEKLHLEELEHKQNDKDEQQFNSMKEKDDDVPDDEQAPELKEEPVHVFDGQDSDDTTKEMNKQATQKLDGIINSFNMIKGQFGALLNNLKKEQKSTKGKSKKTQKKSQRANEKKVGKGVIETHKEATKAKEKVVSGSRQSSTAENEEFADLDKKIIRMEEGNNSLNFSDNDWESRKAYAMDSSLQPNGS